MKFEKQNLRKQIKRDVVLYDSGKSENKTLMTQTDLINRTVACALPEDLVTFNFIFLTDRAIFMLFLREPIKI